MHFDQHLKVILSCGMQADQERGLLNNGKHFGFYRFHGNCWGSEVKETARGQKVK
jgi:hypothetical protein